MDPNEFVSKKIIQQTIAELWSTAPRSGPFKTEKLLGTRLKIIARKLITEDKAELHETEGDLWFCLQGSAEFIVGGKIQGETQYIKETKTIRGAAIVNGKHVLLKDGDWLFIPSGQPHQHTAPKKVTLLIIKIPQQQ